MMSYPYQLRIATNHGEPISMARDISNYQYSPSFGNYSYYGGWGLGPQINMFSVLTSPVPCY